MHWKDLFAAFRFNFWRLNWVGLDFNRLNPKYLFGNANYRTFISLLPTQQ